MHVGRGREHPLHIEYIHIGAALSLIQNVLTEAILSHPRLHLSRRIALVTAIGKVIWVQNDLFAKWYVRDGDEFADEMEQVMIEREGYLKGKKIIGDSSESDTDGDDCPGAAAGADGSAPAGACPFTGIKTKMEGLRVSDPSPDSNGTKRDGEQVKTT